MLFDFWDQNNFMNQYGVDYLFCQTEMAFPLISSILNLWRNDFFLIWQSVVRMNV